MKLREYNFAVAILELWALAKLSTDGTNEIGNGTTVNQVMIIITNV
jgi:hypothetical protein